jgi:YHYH protein
MNRLTRPIHFALLILSASVFSSCAVTGGSTSTGDGSSTAGVLCDLSTNVFNSSAAVNKQSTSKWSCSSTERSLTSNSIPDHEVGAFPNVGNPNTIAEVAASAKFTLMPVATGTVTTLGGPRGAVAYALNGIKFDPDTGGTCDDTGKNCSGAGGTGNWRMEALGQKSFNFGTDGSNAHVQPTGDYHYHGLPAGVMNKLSKGKTMTLIGWAADGFPVYGRYGYTKATDAKSAIKVMTGSYKTKATPDANRPATSMYAMGTFKQDWEYAAGSGDLDDCNGRVGVTPEFPKGIYHYYATDTYPFAQRCVKGKVTVAAGNGPPPGGAPPK